MVMDCHQEDPSLFSFRLNGFDCRDYIGLFLKDDDDRFGRDAVFLRLYPESEDEC